MKKIALITVAASTLVFVALAGTNSGLKKGEKVTPFHPKHVSGPLAKTENCFPCTFQNRPQTQVWVNGYETASTAKIAATLEGAMNKFEKKEFKALIVYVVEKSKIESTYKSIADDKGLAKYAHVGVSVIAKDNPAVKAYKVSCDGSVKNTVFVYKNWQVTDKFVNLEADKKGIASLEAAISNVVK